MVSLVQGSVRIGDNVVLLRLQGAVCSPWFSFVVRVLFSRLFPLQHLFLTATENSPLTLTQSSSSDVAISHSTKDCSWAFSDSFYVIHAHEPLEIILHQGSRVCTHRLKCHWNITLAKCLVEFQSYYWHLKKDLWARIERWLYTADPTIPRSTIRSRCSRFMLRAKISEYTSL